MTLTLAPHGDHILPPNPHHRDEPQPHRMGAHACMSEGIHPGMCIRPGIRLGEATASEDSPAEASCAFYLLCQPSPLREANHCPI